MKVLTVQRQDGTTGTEWVDHESVFTLFKSREGKLAKTADEKAGYVRSHYRFYPDVRTRVIENTMYPARTVLKVCAFWSLIGAMALTFAVLAGGLIYLFGRAFSDLNHHDRDYASLRSSVLDETPDGHTRTAEAAYDLTSECLKDQGLTESAASLHSRCQSLSLDFINKGSFPDSDKQAARYVVTGLMTRTLQLDAKYGY